MNSGLDLLLVDQLIPRFIVMSEVRIAERQDVAC